MATVSAGTAAFVGFQQWRLAKRKLDFDLFEKRFAVYEAVRDLIREASQKQGWPEETDREFQRQLEVSKFLFPRDIPDWLDQLRRTVLELAEASEAVADTPREDPARAGYYQTKQDGLRYLREQYPRLAEHFAKHMTIVTPPYKASRK